jgi:hypothetical protein
MQVKGELVLLHVPAAHSKMWLLHTEQSVPAVLVLIEVPRRPLQA